MWTTRQARLGFVAARTSWIGPFEFCGAAQRTVLQRDPAQTVLMAGWLLMHGFVVALDCMVGPQGVVMAGSARVRGAPTDEKHSLFINCHQT